LVVASNGLPDNEMFSLFAPDRRIYGSGAHRQRLAGKHFNNDRNCTCNQTPLNYLSGLPEHDPARLRQTIGNAVLSAGTREQDGVDKFGLRFCRN
jgi:hypothetical protein